MSDLDIKALTDRARVVQSYIDQERSRVLDLISAVDDREFLIYCIENSWTAVEVPRAREMFDQSQPETDNPWD